VILLEVDTKRIAGLEFECDAPWSVDVNGITLWFAAQWMEVEAGQAISAGKVATSSMSTRRRMRPCIFLSILPPQH
jgi:hypothetical protein